MQKLFKNLFLSSVIITGLLVAFTPMISHAKQTDSNPVGVAVTVTSNLTLTLDTHSLNLGSIPVGSLATGNFTATVTTNRTYTLSIAGDGSNNMLLDGASIFDSSNQIPGNGTVATGSTGWGVRLNATAGAWQNIVSSPSPIFTSSGGPVTNEATKFDVGVAAGPGLVSGNYTGRLTVTAANV